MVKVTLTREVRIPDPVRLELLARSPWLGPEILFFSGGTALRSACRELVRYTHNSIHIITPFDSGGSSAVLREAFHMPAIGDVRNRLMALADQSLLGNPQVFALFAHRFPKKAKQADLHEELSVMARGRHPLVNDIPDPMRKIIRNQFRRFLDFMPDRFNLKGASMGNLILTAGYLDARRQLDPVIYLFSKLVNVRGTVRPVVNRNLHLAAELEDGQTMVGQHLLTGKEAPAIDAPVTRLFLTESREDLAPVEISIRQKIKDQIARAGLICYPMGSFYTSLVANLLPHGVGPAVASNPCPKVYIPSTGKDPEAFGMSVADQVETLLQYLKKDAPSGIRNSQVLNFVLVDTESGSYPGGLDTKAIEAQGVRVIDCPLAQGPGKDLKPEHLVPALLSLA